MSMNFDDEEPEQRPSSPRGSKTAPAKAASGKSKSPSKPASPRSRNASPGGGNFIVSPKTLRPLSKTVSDSKTGGKKANRLYEDLFTDRSPSKLGRGSVADAVREAKSYATLEQAKAAAQEARDAAGPQTKADGPKQYYFNLVTNKPSQKKLPGALGPFKTKYEASLAGYEAKAAESKRTGKEFTAKKPTKPRSDEDDAKFAERRHALVGTKVVNGNVTNDWRVVVEKDGKRSSNWSLVEKILGENFEQYTDEQKRAVTSEKSSSTKAAKSGKAPTTKAELDQAVRDAIAAGAKEESVRKAAGDADRTISQRRATVDLLRRNAEAKSGGGKAKACVKRVVNGKVTGQATTILDAEGNVARTGAMTYAKEYAASKGMKVDSKASDAELLKMVKAGIKAGLFQQSFGDSEKSKCAQRKGDVIDL